MLIIVNHKYPNCSPALFQVHRHTTVGKYSAGFFLFLCVVNTNSLFRHYVITLVHAPKSKRFLIKTLMDSRYVECAECGDILTTWKYQLVLNEYIVKRKERNRLKTEFDKSRRISVQRNAQHLKSYLD